MPERCSHLDFVRPPRRTRTAAKNAVAMGDTGLHLRLCRTCGHVGCCDDSKNRHATKHFLLRPASDHVVARAGEDWSWCYIDELVMELE